MPAPKSTLYFADGGEAERCVTRLMTAYISLMTGRNYALVLCTDGTIVVLDSESTLDTYLKMLDTPKKIVVLRRVGRDSNNIIATTRTGVELPNGTDCVVEFVSRAQAVRENRSPFLSCWRRGISEVHFSRSIGACENLSSIVASGFMRYNFGAAMKEMPLTVATAEIEPGETPLVAYYADMVDMFFGKKSTARVGVWFRDVAGYNLRDSIVDAIVGLFKPTVLFFLSEQKNKSVGDFYALRTSGLESSSNGGVTACMSKPVASLCDIPIDGERSEHPTEMYTRNLDIAYLTREGTPKGRVTARCVVDRKNKRYIRRYGDAARLEAALVREGYTAASTITNVECGAPVIYPKTFPPVMSLPYFDASYGTQAAWFRDADGSTGLWLHGDDIVPMKKEGREYSRSFSLSNRHMGAPIRFADGIKFLSNGAVSTHVDGGSVLWCLDSDDIVLDTIYAPGVAAKMANKMQVWVCDNGCWKVAFVDVARFIANDMPEWGFRVLDAPVRRSQLPFAAAFRRDDQFNAESKQYILDRIGYPPSIDVGSDEDNRRLIVDFQHGDNRVSVAQLSLLRRFTVGDDGVISAAGWAWEHVVDGVDAPSAMVGGLTMVGDNAVRMSVRSNFIETMKNVLKTRVSTPKNVTDKIVGLTLEEMTRVVMRMNSGGGTIQYSEALANVVKYVPEARDAIGRELTSMGWVPEPARPA